MTNGSKLHMMVVMAFIAFMLLLVLSITLKGQDTKETTWRVEVNEGYTNLSNQATNNGSLTSLGVRVAKHWNARLDYFAISSPLQSIILLGPEYNFSFGHILPQSSFIDTTKYEGFVSARAGAGRADSQSAPYKFSFAIGGGLKYRISERLELRPLEVSYVRAPGVNQFIGNHLEFASGFGIRLGKSK